MLVEGQVFKIKVNGKNIQHYKNMGYDCVVGETIDVEAKNLTKKNENEVEIECDICHSKYKTKFENLINMSKKNYFYQCRECEKMAIWNRVLDICKLSNSELISNYEDYATVKSRLKYRCNEHSEETRETTINTILRFNRFPCVECKKVILSKLQKEDFTIVSNLFRQRKYQLISNESDYANAHVKLKYICPNHPDVIQEISYDKLKGGRGCRFCKCEMLSDRFKMDINVVKEEFNKKNLMMIDTTYKNNVIPIKFICKNHIKEGEQYISYGGLKRAEHPCKYCLKEYKEDSNYGWKGGITPLHNYIRSKINKWKEDSFQNDNYTCQVTCVRSGNKTVHHISKNFSEILMESLQILGLQPNKKIGEYTDEQLNSIERTVNELHYGYGLGITLKQEIHELFHRKYSKVNNTPDQFEEFKERYYKGEFDNELSEELKSYNSIKRLKLQEAS